MTDIVAEVTFKDIENAEDIRGKDISPTELLMFIDRLDGEKLGVRGIDVEVDVKQTAGN